MYNFTEKKYVDGKQVKRLDCEVEQNENRPAKKFGS